MEIFRDGPAPMISAMCRSIGITQTVDTMVRWDDKQCKLSPGLRVEAIIINTLTNRRPLYRLEEFFSDLDVSKMFGPGVKAEDINDDAVGRALDKLAEANPREVYGTVSLQAACREGVSVEVLHADTTSVSVQGAYEGNQEDDALWLTFGYSKQKRPDLKQFMYGLGVTGDHIPVIGEVRNGNTSDPRWNHDMINRLRKWLGETKDVVYVADSSLVSGPNLKAMKEQGVSFISRIPGTFHAESALKDRAWGDGTWQYVGALSQRKGAASYRLQSYQEELDGIRYRFIVVHSSKLDGRKEKSLERRLGKTEGELKRELKELAKREFACEPDAHEAWRNFLKKRGHDGFEFVYEVRREERVKPRSKRGRPPKDYTPEWETVFSLHPAFSRNEEVITEMKSRASCFVLITNLLEDWTDERILQEYKNQTVVEQHFSFIKNPKVVGPIYLKNPERIKALAYVFLMALLVYSMIQRRVRLALKESDEPIEVYDKRSSFTPTGRSILTHFHRVNIAVLRGTRYLPEKLTLVRRLLGLLGLSEDVYLRWIPP